MEEQTVSDSFRMNAYGVFEGRKGWTRDKSDLALRVAGLHAVSAMNFAEKLLERLDVEPAQRWLESCLAESSDYADAANRLRLRIDTRFAPDRLLLCVRGMLVALDGNYQVESPLDKLPIPTEVRRPTSADYHWRERHYNGFRS